MVYVAIGIAIVGWIGTILYLTYGTGRKVADLENHTENAKEDIQMLLRAISLGNDRHEAFYKEYIRFRIKVASKLGINGGE